MWDDDYSYYSFEEESIPEVNYTLPDTFHDPQPPTPPPETPEGDTSIVRFHSINSSRDFIQNNLGVPPSQLRNAQLPGIVILRLSDYSLLRNDSRCHRLVPHLFVVANTEDFPQRHPEFAAAIQVLNQ